MYVIEITDSAQIRRVVSFCESVSRAYETGELGTNIRFAIDPLDSGFKISVERGTWSPPVKGAITGMVQQ